MKARKVTEFEGFMSGDFECFCLCKVPFAEWVEKQRELHKIPLKNKNGFLKCYEESESLTLYPSYFFPKDCKEGKWKFKITVEAERV